MCTVVFIPGREQYYFASLRDEDTERPCATEPALYKEGTLQYLAPKDGLAGGTWIGINEMQHVIILLNGAFEKHTAGNNYRKSRGLIVTELLVSETPVIDWYAMELKQIEPFTLIVWSSGDLFQLVWDGECKKKIRPDAHAAHIWSSSTLYNTEAGANREKQFQHWITKKPAVSMESLLSFFLSEADTENGFIINRNEKIKTLSYSFITITQQGSGLMQYYDFVQNKTRTKEIMPVSKESRYRISDAL